MPEFDFMRDETLQDVNKNLKECNLYLKTIAEGRKFDVADIQTVKDISKAGLARKYFSEGDQIVVDYTDVDGNTYSMPWDMCLGKTATLADGTVREGIYLKSHFVTIESHPFDAAETEGATEATATAGLYYYGYDGSTYTLLSLSAGDTVPYDDYTAIYHNAVKDTTCSIIRYGYNRYSHSAYHQWLNSTADKGAWWTAQHVGDVAPNTLNSTRGFLAGLPEDFVAAAEPILIGRALNTVTEPDKSLIAETVGAKFFLPSLEQHYIKPELADVEGAYWDYYKVLAEDAGLPGQFQRYTTYPALTNYALSDQTYARSMRLGSAVRGGSCNVWREGASGDVYNGSACDALRACPACFI
jgi:hypothetical protein